MERGSQAATKRVAALLTLPLPAVAGCVCATLGLPLARTAGEWIAGTPWGARPWIAAAGVDVAAVLAASLAWDLARRSPRSRTIRRALALLVIVPLALAAVVPRAAGLECTRARGTVRDMAAILWALEAYRHEHGSYPAWVGESGGLASVLEPTWLQRVPRLDAWSRPLEVSVEPDGFRIDASRGLHLTNMGLGAWPMNECRCPGDLLQPPDSARDTAAPSMGGSPALR